MGVILWLVFGALVGWLASIIMNTNREQGAIANVIIGIVGAFIGGMLSRLMGGPTVTGFNFTSILVAVLGAALLIFFIRMISGNRRDTSV